MSRKKLQILIFLVLLLVWNPVGSYHNKIFSDTTNISQVGVEKTTVIEPKPVIRETKVEKNVQVIPIVCSFYTSSIEDCGKTDAISASGKNLNNLSRGSEHITYVAAPKTIKFGTQINVEGVGICQVEDRGGAIKYVTINGVKYMKLDVFVPGATRKQLLQKGIVKTKGYIINEQGN